MKLLPLLTAAAVLAAISPTPVLAGPDTSKNPPPLQTTEPDNGWWFRAAPYVWATAITGDVGVGPYVTSVDLSISDLLKHFDVGFMMVLEGGYERWGFGTDVIYARVSGSADLNGPFFKSTHLRLEEWYITPRVTWNVFRNQGSDLDLLAGARIFAMDTTLDLQGGLPAVHAESSKAWIDPIVGFRGRCELGGNFFFNYYGDVGGFDAASKITWQAVAGLGYRLNAASAVGIGYRALGDDYHRDGLLMKIVSHGPYIGFEYRW